MRSRRHPAWRRGRRTRSRRSTTNAPSTSTAITPAATRPTRPDSRSTAITARPAIPTSAAPRYRSMTISGFAYTLTRVTAIGVETTHTTSVRASSDASRHRRMVSTAPASPRATRPRRSHAIPVAPTGPDVRSEPLVPRSAAKRSKTARARSGRSPRRGRVTCSARDRAEHHVEQLEHEAEQPRGDRGHHEHREHGDRAPSPCGRDGIEQRHERRGSADEVEDERV